MLKVYETLTNENIEEIIKVINRSINNDVIIKTSDKKKIKIDLYEDFRRDNFEIMIRNNGKTYIEARTNEVKNFLKELKNVERVALAVRDRDYI